MNRFKFMFGTLLILSVLILSSVWKTTEGAVPKLINFQGVLKDGSGNPVANGAYSVTFTIYDDPSAGNVLWAETSSVSTTSGLFTVLLGSLNPVPDSAFQDTTRYLGVKVGADPEMTPRQQLVSLSYAYRVSSVDGASGGTITSKVSIGPGHINTGFNAFVAGDSNNVSGNYATIDGGLFNQASGDWAAIGGGHLNQAAGSGATIGGGSNNVASGPFNSFIGGGYGNQASGQDAAIGGGNINTASGLRSFLGGGSYNKARGAYSAVGGGGGSNPADSNSASGNWSTISGGRGNKARGLGSAVGGGYNNTASGDSSAIGGGSGNLANSEGATVGGGLSDTASGYGSVVDGGSFNVASGAHASIGGGYANRASGPFDATVGGGAANTASGDRATVGGGRHNTAGGSDATVGGGISNTASGNFSTVGGGSQNKARGWFSAVCGGGGFTDVDSNSALGDFSFIGGGAQNLVSGEHATVSGGLNDTASGHKATVPGGFANKASGNFSLAAGQRAKAVTTGAFVWADATNADFASTASNQFLIRASGGVGIGTNSPAGQLHVGPGGAGIAGELLTVSAASGNQGISIRSGSGITDFTALRLFRDATEAASIYVENNNLFRILNGVALDGININTSGNVGIGTTAPAFKLDVAGSAHATSFPTSSDNRLKKNIKPLTGVLEKIEKIHGVSFDWNETYEELGRSSGHREIGVIAQDVEAVFPELVSQWGDENYRGVDYGRMTAVLIEAVKELNKKSTEVDELKTRIEQLEKAIQKLLIKKEGENQPYTLKNETKGGK